MGNLGEPFIPIHPGEIIKEELEFRKISQKQFAQIVDFSYTMLNDVLNCKRAVATDFSFLIESLLGINAEMLVNMQTRYNLQLARQNKKNIDKFEKLRNICASLL